MSAWTERDTRARRRYDLVLLRRSSPLYAPLTLHAAPLPRRPPARLTVRGVGGQSLIPRARGGRRRALGAVLLLGAVLNVGALLYQIGTVGPLPGAVAAVISDP
mgnify:CR=1 FL=1